MSTTLTSRSHSNPAYLRPTLNLDIHKFYKEAFRGISLFDCKKGISSNEDWNNESILYNPQILEKTGNTLKITKDFRSNQVFKLGQPLDEKAEEARGTDQAQVSLWKI